MNIAQERPGFTPQAAAALVQTHYGLPVTADKIEELPGERDQNFRLRTASGAQYVLKIAHAAEEVALLQLQQQVLAWLAPHVPCPQVVPTPAGATLLTLPTPAGTPHLVRLLTYLPGKPLGQYRPHRPRLLRHLGHTLGHLDAALAEFPWPEQAAAQRYLAWDLQHAAAITGHYLAHIADPGRAALVDQLRQQFLADAAPHLPHLRRSLIHSDANDYNVLVHNQAVSGLIDFGDMVHSCTIFELAIAAAYAMLDKADPLTAAAHVVAGYHAAYPLTELEISLLYHLIAMRLATSVCVSAYRRHLVPGNPYLAISEQPAWRLLDQLADLPPQLAHYTFRHACGLEPVPHSPAIAAYLQAQAANARPVLLPPPGTTPQVLDLSVSSPLLANLPEGGEATALSRLLAAEMAPAGATLALGRYDEARLLYTDPAFRQPNNEFDEWRTVHLGLDLFMPAGTPVYAPLPGRLHSAQNNAAPQDYGPTLILQHQTDEGQLFYTLYGHLAPAGLDQWPPGQAIAAGQQLGTLGDEMANGGWPPHLHFQVITDLLGRVGQFPGVAPAGQRAIWRSLSPDPNLLLALPALPEPPPGRDPATSLQLRRRHLGPSLSLSYREPLPIVRGRGQYLYDDTGRAYLDGVNNVSHVGHSHPHVVRAAQQQLAVLNTNTRYLHPLLGEYAARLTATLPEPLSVCFFVCSGSEANELALRLARTHTGREDLLVIDGAYHGNTAALIDASPYKHNGPGGRGAPPHIHAVPMPDPYRGRFPGPDSGPAYARLVQAAIAAMQAQGRAPAGFIAEPVLGCGGQVVLPAGYLQQAFAYVRAAGGLCIADEVQVGFGRVGSHFWGFQTQGVLPDIVTLGKPIGNGHPLAAVVTTPAIAASFANGMEYFNTFGGNPVSCAVGLAVLDVLESEGLQAHARQVGERLLAGLRGLMTRHTLIGDVRGLGLFVGVELVTDRVAKHPAGGQAAYVVERMKERGILISSDGPDHNVLKLKPPLVFSAANADHLVQTLDEILAEDALYESGAANPV